MSETITWSRFSRAYANCVGKVAEFATELAIDSHQSLGIPYVDPFTLRGKKLEDEVRQEQDRLRNRVSFEKFAEEVRKTQPFLRKATEKELEGIFARLTPGERKKYAEPAPSPVAAPSRKRIASVPSKGPRDAKKSREVLGDFINDESDGERGYQSGESDDVSLVSESELEEPSPMHKKEKKQTIAPPNAKAAASSSGVKKFTWT